MNVLDLFSGIGGFSLGLERAGMRIVAFCECDPFCQCVLRKHWPDVPIFDDVRTLPVIGGIDVICGGFPCQPFSSAARGRHAQQSLWPAMLAVVERSQDSAKRNPEMRKVINLRDAQVSTATIEIKTLTVSNKQVTLAVFRQLIEQDLISEEGNLNGVPWGLVNYHPDKCGEYRSHLHVVWQTGRDLRRSLIYLEPFYNNPLWIEEMDIASDLATRDYLMGRIESPSVQLDGTSVIIGPDAPEYGHYSRSQTPSAHDALTAYNNQYGHHYRYLSDDQEEEFKAYKNRQLAEFERRHDLGEKKPEPADFREVGEQWPLADIYFGKDSGFEFAGPDATKINDYIDWVDQQEPRLFRKFLPIVHAAILGEMQRRKRWQDQVDKLQNLPQLFIAV